MITKEEGSKNKVIAWAVYMICTISMTVMSIAAGWPTYVFWILWVLAIALTAETFCKRVSVKLQSYSLMLFAMTDIFVCSILEGELYPSMLVMLGCSVMIAVYSDSMLLVIQAVLAMAFIGIHVFWLHTVALDTFFDVVGLLVRVGVLAMTILYLSSYIWLQKRIQKKLSENMERAQQAEQAKANFLANMSHEIRTPMNAIIGMCELFLREENISPNVREYGFQIQNSGRSLLSIINDILDFSKIEAGRIELIEDEFNIASTINDVVNMTMARMGDKKIELIVNVDPNIPKGLVGDEIRIRQVMVNLMTNAVKFTNQGVIVLKITQSKQKYGINLSVSVTDSGIGITPENQERLFNSFSQVDTKKNRKIEGTGLGLAISRQLIKQMGGFIGVSSEYGRGSQFKFVIPLKVSQPEPFIVIENAEHFDIVGLVEFNKFGHEAVAQEYKKLIETIGRELKLSYQFYKKPEELKSRIENGGVTHCIVGKEEFLNDRVYFEKLAEQMEIVLIQDRQNAIPVPDGIKCIYKPFYALSVAAAFNNESISLGIGEVKQVSAGFTAPQAKVLIVDDNVVNLKVAAGLMQPYHMQVFVAESGDEAIRMLESKDFHIVFMDHMMPVKDGVETTREIRAKDDCYYKKLPIIALTANAVGNAKSMFSQAGLDDFIAKPIELSMLDKILKRWLPKELRIKASDADGLMTENAEPAAVQKPHTAQEYPALKKADCLEGLLDLELGLSHIGGDAQMYREILDIYVKCGKEKKEFIQELYESEKWNEYTIEVHALKSSSLTLGAQELSELAREMEKSGKEGDYAAIHKKNAAMLSLYEQVVNAGKLYLEQYAGGRKEEVEQHAEVVEAEAKEVTRQELEQLLERLREAGDAFDSEAMLEILKEGMTYQLEGKAVRGIFEKAAKLTDEFEYEEAVKTAYSVIG